MANYRIWLSVKDGRGGTTEIPGGTVEIDLKNLTAEALESLQEKLTLNEYLKKVNIDEELERYATDQELAVAVDSSDTLVYNDFLLDTAEDLE